MGRTTIHIDDDLKKQLLNDCKEIYLAHHPEMRHLHITQEKILYEVIAFYIKTG